MNTRRHTDPAADLRAAVRWATAGAGMKQRHARLVAVVFASIGADAFPDCASLGDVCTHTGISERTMRHYLHVLRIDYRRNPPGLMPADVLPSAKVFAAEKMSEPVDEKNIVETADEIFAAACSR